MTIILSTKRDDFAVLAADRLLGRRGSVAGYERKVVLHPSLLHLPLAFAVGGLMIFSVERRLEPEYAMTHVAEFAGTIPPDDQLIITDIAARLKQRFQAEMDRAIDTMHVFIAVVKDRKADVGVLQVSAKAITAFPTHFRHGCDPLVPDSILPFYNREKYAAYLHAPEITDQNEVGRRARVVAESCIEYELSSNPCGENKVIGGPVDVVIVTAEGARLFPRS